MFHTVAYAASAQGINATLTALPSITDQALRTTGNGYVVPSLNHVPLIVAFGPSMTRAQISSVTLQQLAKQELKPLMTTFPTAGLATTPVELYGNPLDLTPFEELDVNITNTASDGEYVIVWLSDGPLNPLPFSPAFSGPYPAQQAPGPGGTPTILTGQPFTLRATAAVTLTVAGWTLCQLTMDQNLFPGHYQIIGLEALSANIVAARFVAPGNAWRPGGIGRRVVSAPSMNRQRMGGWGVWAEFDSIQLPAIEVLAQVADTSETFDLDLIRTGPVSSQPPGQVH